MSEPGFLEGRLRMCASVYSCRNCPPERVCAWACVQGAGLEDIVIGAVMEQVLCWSPPEAEAEIEPEIESTDPALWDSFNT